MSSGCMQVENAASDGYTTYYSPNLQFIIFQCDDARKVKKQTIIPVISALNKT